MIETLRDLRQKMVIGFVGGSDLVKIAEQLQVGDTNGKNFDFWNLKRLWILFKFLSSSIVIDEFDYAFSENGLTAFKSGKALPSQSFINFLGEEKYKPLVNFILHYLADLDIPVKR